MAVGGGLLAAVVVAVTAMRAASRLDRLHVRTDAAWAALDAALRRRAGAVRALPCDAALRHAADAALRAGPAWREEAENELGRLLGALHRQALPPAVVTQLADIEQRVLIARRVYNDAVRDTLALRSRRMVRWFRLAGTAPMPRYFEIVESSLAGYELELDGAGA
jgi:hypothetical protein